MDFIIDKKYLTSVSTTKYIFSGKTEDERLVETLKGNVMKLFGTNDHPEFSKLREQLGREEYINIQRGWWNGDEVLKSFTLNGFKFNVGDQFPSGAAIKNHIEFGLK